MIQNRLLKNSLVPIRDLHRKTLARDVAEFVVRFKNEHEFTLKFNKAAIEAIIDISLESGKNCESSL